MIETKRRPSDPRVIRTRALLLRAFAELLGEKSFSTISVQDVAERATVNRATFYAHFEDKYDLLDGFIREQFMRHVPAHLVSAGLSQRSLQALARSAFAFYAELRNHNCTPTDKLFDPLVQTAVQQSLHTILLGWLRQAPPGEPRQPEELELSATALSWAIFGAANHWSHSDQRRLADDQIERLVAMLLGGVASALPRDVAQVAR